MSRPFPPHRFLSGNFAPIRTECDAPDLILEGELPTELRGTYYRNGANPLHPPREGYHPFGGDGMVHALRIEEGRVAYRNRWVRTDKWRLDAEHGEALWGAFGNPMTSDPRTKGTPMNVANTAVVWHGGRLLALDEGNGPFEIDPLTLDPIGPWRFGDALLGPMTAHPKIDPDNGEMLFFGYGVDGMHLPAMRFHVADASGKLIRSDGFDAPHASMVHDFIVTRGHVVFPVFSATTSLERVTKGGPFIAWDEGTPTQLGIMKRDAPIESIEWKGADPIFCYHPLNAYDEGDRVVADMFVYGAAPGFPGPDGSRPDPKKASARLERWTIDPEATGNAYTAELLDPVDCEFGRIDERFLGRPYRHAWYVATEGDQGRHGQFDELIHLDLQTGQRRRHAFGSGHWAAEPIFVPRSDVAEEGDGFVLTLVYRPDEHRSDFLVFEAKAIEGGPIAVARLETRVPNGFHASWRPAVGQT